MRRSKHLTPKMCGWLRVWRIMQGLYGSMDCLDAESGEVWHYMGTAIVEGRRVHQFRHRHLKGERTYRDIPVLNGDFKPAEPWYVGGTVRSYATAYGARMASARFGWTAKPVRLDYL